MNLRAVGWGLAFVAAGIAFAAGLVGQGFALGPRIGLATFFIVAGLVLLGASFAATIRDRTHRIEGSRAKGCPVGATCGCGHFNFKPRKTCRQCGAATLYAA